MPQQAPSILLVDDDTDLLRLLTMRLSAAGYQVSTAESAEAALAQLAVAQPTLVISDVRLPGLDGLQLFDEIRAQHPALPVILLTAHGTIPDAVDATSRGAFAYLREKMDVRKANGGVFLGLNGTVVKSHGGADGTGVAAAIDLAVAVSREVMATHVGEAAMLSFLGRVSAPMLASTASTSC